MADQDIFDAPEDTGSPPLNNENQEQGGSVEDLLKTITRPDGSQKYPDVATALKALASSQEHIATLEAERSNERTQLEDLKKKVEKVETMESSINDLLSRIEQNKETPSSFNPDEIATLVKKTIDQDKQADALRRNRLDVEKNLKDRFGEKTKEVVTSVAEKNGLTIQELGVLSESKPKLVLSLFGSTPASSPNSTPSSSVHFPAKVVEPELELPAKSLLEGSSTKDQVDFMRQIRDKVYKQYNVET